MTKRVLTGLQLDKIAAVDAPCQEHASADILKRDFTAEERRAAAARGEALPDGSFPIASVKDLENAIHDIGRAKDEAKAKAHIVARAKALGATDKLPDGWSVSKSASSGDLKDNQGASGMSAELKKALGLADTASDADIAKAVATALETVSTLQKANALHEAIAKMSDKHKAFMNHPEAKLPKGGKDAFASMSAGERDDHIKANPLDDGDGDEDVAKALASGEAFRTPEGAVVAKRKVGAELFSVLKSQNDLLIKQGADLAKAKEDAAIAEFAKRATDIGFGTEFGPTLRKAYGGDSAAQAEVEKRITALQKQVSEGALFSNFGKSSPTEGSAEAELVAKAEEIRKANPKLSEHQARARAYTQHPDLYKRMKAEATA